MSKVLITVTGLATTPAGTDPNEIKVTTTGELTPIEGGWRLDYDEIQPDGKSKEDIRVEMTQEQVTMNRSGAFGTTMVFIKDKLFQSHYKTPYGPIGLNIFTTRMSVDCGPESGRLFLKYEMELQQIVQSCNELTLEYRACGRKN